MNKPSKRAHREGAKRRREEESTHRAAASPRPRAKGYEKVFEKIYRLVLRIPRGRVMTYGQIARLLEERYSPRLVGWAMHATPQDERNIPWHRVVNSRGGISTGRVILAEPDRQRLMLEAEGVVFDERGHCDISVFQWSPRQRAAKTKLKSLRTKAGDTRARASVKATATGKRHEVKKESKRRRER